MLPHLPINPGTPAALNCTVPTTHHTHTEQPLTTHYSDTINNKRNFINHHAEQNHIEIVTSPSAVNTHDTSPTRIATHGECKRQQAVHSIVTTEWIDSGDGDVRQRSGHARRRRRRKVNTAQTDSHNAGGHTETDSTDADQGSQSAMKATDVRGDGGDKGNDQTHGDERTRCDKDGAGGDIPDGVTLQTQHADHGLAQIIDYIQNGDLPDDSRQARRILLTKHCFAIRNGKLLHLRINRRKNNNPKQAITEQIYIPEQLIQTLLARYHAQLMHCGYEKECIGIICTRTCATTWHNAKRAISQ